MDATALTSFIHNSGLIAAGEKVLLAVSGGIDSVVMAHLFRQTEFAIGIVHCNFRLRGDESDRDEQFVLDLARHMNVPFFVQKFETKQFATSRGISVQMAARELRYSWFEEIRRTKGFHAVATAHHLDDQVETFFINLIRGTGIAGLHGIPLKTNSIIRPMMFAYRSNIEAYARLHHVKYRTDSTNNEVKYLRNRIRHELLPVISGINPEFPARLNESIEKIRDFELIGNKALDGWRKNLIQGDPDKHLIEIRSLRGLEPLQLHIWHLLSPFGFNETQVANIIDSFNKEHHTTFNSVSHKLVKERDTLVITGIRKPSPPAKYSIKAVVRSRSVRKPIQLNLKRIALPGKFEIPANENIATLDANKLKYPLVLRKWEHGDSFHPLGMQKTKKLSDFFIDNKFSASEKDDTWLLCSGKHIIWIVGHRIDHRYRLTAATKEVLMITFDRETSRKTD